jgi:hypothetical protein
MSLVSLIVVVFVGNLFKVSDNTKIGIRDSGAYRLLTAVLMALFNK